jgi:hypothetical protein
VAAGQLVALLPEVQQAELVRLLQPVLAGLLPVPRKRMLPALPLRPVPLVVPKVVVPVVLPTLVMPAVGWLAAP